MCLRPLLLLCASIGLSACTEAEKNQPVTPPATVKTVVISSQGQSLQTAFAGTVRARAETPLAFEVGGRIQSRRIDAGQSVKQGQVLFTLDAREARQRQASAEAALLAARAELAVATSELARHRDLFARNVISQQVLERVVLAEQAAASRLQMAEAGLAQARLALEYTDLRARAPGIIMEVSGETGQVVAPGQPVAILADARELEIELHLSDGMVPPEQGEAMASDGSRVALALREVAGAADPASRTWRTRYSVKGDAAGLRLGALVRVSLGQAAGQVQGVYSVPIAALDERGKGPQVWRIVDGKVQPEPVQVLGVTDETAQIMTTLPQGTSLVALGTHLLVSGMEVREYKP